MIILNLGQSLNCCGLIYILEFHFNLGLSTLLGVWSYLLLLCLMLSGWIKRIRKLVIPGLQVFDEIQLHDIKAKKRSKSGLKVNPDTVHRVSLKRAKTWSCSIACNWSNQVFIYIHPKPCLPKQFAHCLILPMVDWLIFKWSHIWRFIQ